jgi:NitT/TauT family transport system ATP-binding protein
MSASVSTGSAGRAAVEVKVVSHSFVSPDGKAIPILENIDLSVAPGEFLAIVGPSGCGKTTLLNMVAGIQQPTDGDAYLFGARVDGISLRVGYVFARDALLPWKTSLENVSFGLALRKVPRAEQVAQAADWLRRVGLAGFELSYRSELSQGMRQRVSLARTLVTDPTVVLMDEPFASLDAITKLDLHQQFCELWEGTGKTVILVTHDLEEAILLADRVMVMTRRPGRIAGMFRIDLPRPRRIEEARLSESFSRYVREMWTALRGAPRNEG